MKRKLTTTALMGLLGISLALGSAGAIARDHDRERVGFGINIGVPVYEAPDYAYPPATPYYYGDDGPNYGPSVELYYGHGWGYHHNWREHEGRDHDRWEHRR